MNKSLEVVLEHKDKALSTLFLDFLILLCSFIYPESSELVDRWCDSLNKLKKFRYKYFKCLFLAITFYLISYGWFFCFWNAPGNRTGISATI